MTDPTGMSGPVLGPLSGTPTPGTAGAGGVPNFQQMIGQIPFLGQMQGALQQFSQHLPPGVTVPPWLTGLMNGSGGPQSGVPGAGGTGTGTGAGTGAGTPPPQPGQPGFMDWLRQQPAGAQMPPWAQFGSPWARHMWETRLRDQQQHTPHVPGGPPPLPGRPGQPGAPGGPMSGVPGAGNPLPGGPPPVTTPPVPPAATGGTGAGTPPGSDGGSRLYTPPSNPWTYGFTGGQNMFSQPPAPPPATTPPTTG